MAKPIRFLDEAIAEANEAWTWYRDRSERAAQRFRAAFEQAIQRIADNPEGWGEYLRGTRCISLCRFPYIIVFRETADEVQVIAVAHTHRREGYWKKRVK
ncbi:MAG: type II toxin-antitoxin system RelE/ParE family toxin [Planctomycetes bacterium]|nr:type II toxin-antitoxin system RelE/ParE family toxin [Planctomycetota bacterium]